MTPNQYPNVSTCLSRCPSKHTREERAKSVFVSGVSVVSARGELIEFRKRTFGSAGRRAINVRPAASAETRETGIQQPRRERSGKRRRAPGSAKLFDLSDVPTGVS